MPMLRRVSSNHQRLTGKHAKIGLKRSGLVSLSLR